MTTIVKRPTDRAGIQRLIRERKANIRKLEAALALPLPTQDRKHLRQRLAGERANLESWQTYLMTKKGK